MSDITPATPVIPGSDSGTQISATEHEAWGAEMAAQDERRTSEIAADRSAEFDAQMSQYKSWAKGLADENGQPPPEVAPAQPMSPFDRQMSQYKSWAKGMAAQGHTELVSPHDAWLEALTPSERAQYANQEAELLTSRTNSGAWSPSELEFYEKNVGTIKSKLSDLDTLPHDATNRPIVPAPGRTSITSAGESVPAMLTVKAADGKVYKAGDTYTDPTSGKAYSVVLGVDAKGAQKLGYWRPKAPAKSMIDTGKNVFVDNKGAPTVVTLGGPDSSNRITVGGQGAKKLDSTTLNGDPNQRMSISRGTSSPNRSIAPVPVSKPVSAPKVADDDYMSTGRRKNVAAPKTKAALPSGGLGINDPDRAVSDIDLYSEILSDGKDPDTNEALTDTQRKRILAKIDTLSAEKSASSQDRAVADIDLYREILHEGKDPDTKKPLTDSQRKSILDKINKLSKKNGRG